MERRRILGLLVVASSVLAACEEDVGVVEVRGVLEADDAIDFGDVQIGIEAAATLALRNVGDGPIAVERIDAAGLCTADHEFTVDGRCDPGALAPLSVPAGSTREIPLTFTPFAPRDTPVQVELRFVTSARGEDGAPVTRSVRLTGRGIRAGLEVTPNPIDFGRVLLGSSRTLEVTITNRLGAPTDLFARLADDGTPEIVNMGGLGRFELLDPLPDLARGGSLLPADAKLDPGASVTATLRYVPDPANAEQPDRGRWTLANCGGSLCDVDVMLLGQGTNAAIACDPPAVDFGQVNPGRTATRTVACANVASEAVSVLSWELGLGSAPEYGVTPYDESVARLEPDEAFEIEVTFSPTSGTVGVQPAGRVLVRGRNPIAGRDLDDVRVALTGEAGGPDVQVAPASLVFGRVAIGTESVRRILVANVGFNDLEITGISGDVDGTGAFAAGRRAFVVPAGASEVVEVTFAPLSADPVSSALVLTTNDDDAPEVRVPLSGQGVSLAPCRYTLEPIALGFGLVEVLRTTEQGVRLRNVGTNDCLINDVAIALGSDPDFSLPDGNETDVILAPDETKTIRVAYTPGGEGLHTGDLGFYISDPDDSNPTVPLRGVGTEAALLISPPGIDFGQVGLGCATRDRTLAIYNTGGLTTGLERVEIPPGVTREFEVARVPAGVPGPPGATIGPGVAVEVAVRYRARDVGPDTGVLHLYERGQTDPYVVPLFGSGAERPENEDAFEQLQTPEVDILFVIDNSCSMSEEQASLTANFQSFIQFAAAQALDYRIGVVSTDVNGCPDPAPPNRIRTLDQGQCGYFADGRGDGAVTDPDWRLISPGEQPSPEAAFAAVATQGIDGSGAERGLEAAYRALSSPIVTGWNAGFLRPNAYLALVFVSDEEDQSPNGVDFYVNYFRAIKGFRNQNLFSASAIVGDAPGGCGGFQAEAGARYIEAAQSTGGVFESICTSDWSASLENLGLSVFGYKSRFFLTNQPVPGSVRVFVDGASVDPTGPAGQVRWTYDPNANSVDFASIAVPEPGAQIVVRYQPECL